jgi:Fe-Mn family superoxide dismutase
MEGKMSYEAKDYSSLIGVEGLSETLLRNHFTLYQGYVANTNKLLESLDKMLKESNTGTPEYAELKRRLGWEFNGMRLHELYFENMGGDGNISKFAALSGEIARNFGSYEIWEKDFRATGTMRGIGWVILYKDMTNGRLMNFWINEHDVAHPSGCVPLLVMDVFEHAYMIDYGLKRADYIDVFMKNINWSSIDSRY